MKIHVRKIIRVAHSVNACTRRIQDGWTTSMVILALLVIGFSLKTCAGDDVSNIAKDSRVTKTSTLTQSSQQHTPAMGPTASVSPADLLPTTLYVGPKSLNVRSSPNGEVVHSLKHGTPVEIYAEESGWSRISQDGRTQQWVSSAHLCVWRDCKDSPRWQSAPKTLVVPAGPQRQVSPAVSSAYGCSCSSDSNCYGPRGGRYCITSGGNKRYR